MHGESMIPCVQGIIKALSDCAGTHKAGYIVCSFHTSTTQLFVSSCLFIQTSVDNSRPDGPSAPFCFPGGSS